MILIGDCCASMQEMAANSVDAIVTDPPYGLSKEPDMAEVLQHWLAGDDYKHSGGGFMGKDWDSFVPGPATWWEVYRVLKPGGHALVFAGSRTQDLMSIALRLAGFEVRDTLMWLYGSGFPKSLNVGEGRGTALKPAYEPIIMVRKPLAGTVAANVQQWGTGAINIDACRVPSEVVTGWMGNPGGGGTWNDSNSGLGQRGDPRPVQGRWPANILHDGSPEVVAGFPESKSGSGPKPGTPRTRGAVYGAPTVCKTPQHPPSTGNASRFFYCAKTSKADRNEGCEHLDLSTAGEMTGGRASDSAGIQSPRAGAGRTSGGRNSHPTVKPTDLMRYLCRLVTPPAGLVLDPFAGSGSTGKAAILEGFDFIGCELSDEYAKIAQARIDWAHYQRFIDGHDQN